MCSADALPAHRMRRPRRSTARWDSWAPASRGPSARSPALTEGELGDAREHLGGLAEGVGTYPIDYAELGPEVSGLIWSIPSFTEQLAATELPRLCAGSPQGTARCP